MSQSLLVLVLTILASLATTVQAVSPCNFDRRASELHRYVNLNLVPEKGYSVPIHSDFDRWIDSAPPLERTHQDFHDGNAYFWQESFLKAYTSSILMASPQMRAGIRQLDSHHALRDISAIEPQSAIDRFVKRYTMAALRSAERFRQLTNRAIAICPRDDSKHATENARKQLAEYATEMAPLLYQPLLPWTVDAAKFKPTDDPRFLRRLVYETTVSLSQHSR